MSGNAVIIHHHVHWSTVLFGIYYSLKLLNPLSRIQQITGFAADWHPPSQMWSLECRHMYADVSLPLDNVERVKGTLVSKVERYQGIWKSPTTGVSVVDRLNKGVMFSSNLYFNESTFFIWMYWCLQLVVMPECSNILYCLSQSCPHHIYIAPLSLDVACSWTLQVIFCFPKTYICLKAVLIYITTLICFSITYCPWTFLKTPLVSYYEDTTLVTYYKICQIDSRDIMHCHFLTATTTRRTGTLADWVSRKSQFGRIFVHFHFLLSWVCVPTISLPSLWFRSFTGEDEGHPFPVQGHVLLEEEAEDHLHQIDLVKRGDKRSKRSKSAIVISENHLIDVFSNVSPCPHWPHAFPEMSWQCGEQHSKQSPRNNENIHLQIEIAFMQNLPGGIHRCRWIHSHHKHHHNHHNHHNHRYNIIIVMIKTMKTWGYP